VRTRRPHYGSQFARVTSEDYALRTDDILTEKVFNREYPKALIKTRGVNRTDDITGAQADTRCAAPKLWRVKDPSQTVEKATNRVIDIDGAVAGTGGQGPPLYRARKQAKAISEFGSTFGSSFFGASRTMTAPALPKPMTPAHTPVRVHTPTALGGAPSAAAAARAADIASVQALQ
jgi:hypothetical protein